VSVFVILHISFIISGYTLGVYSVTLSDIQSHLDLNSTQSGFLASSALLGMMIGALFLGMLSDIIGRKKTLLLAITLFSISNGLIVYTNSYHLFALFRFLAGVGVGALTPICVSLLSEYSPKSNRTLLITIVMTGMPLGQLLASFAGLVFLGNHDWRLLYSLSFFGLILIPIVLFFLPESMKFYIKQQKTEQIIRILKKAAIPLENNYNNFVTGQDATTSNLSTLFETQYLKNTLALCLVFFCNMYVFYGVSTWLPNLMYHQGYTMSSSIIFLSVFLLGNIFTAPIIGLFTDRIGYKRLMGLFYIVLAIVICLLSFLIVDYAKYVFVFLIGGCIGVVQNTVLAIIPKFYSLSQRGTAIGVFSACSRFGSFIAPAIVGIMLTFDVELNLVFLFFAIPAIIGLISTLNTKN